ncbi:MAG: S4 domain-containing protein [Pseudomonadales bacterium]
MDEGGLQQVRIDRWLWAARFFKTRSLAKAAIEGGKVTVDGHKPKPAKEITRGQTINVRRGDDVCTAIVLDLSEKRGSASVAQTLYAETPESVERRERNRSQRRMERAGLTVPQTKPSKKQRRDLRKLKDAHASGAGYDPHNDQGSSD